MDADEIALSIANALESIDDPALRHSACRRIVAHAIKNAVCRAIIADRKRTPQGGNLTSTLQ